MGKRDFSVKKRGVTTRKDKPVYLIITEGKNKTETLYLSNFQEQGRPYSIRFVKAGSRTDVEYLYQAILDRWNELGLSGENEDRAFVIIDIDNDPIKARKVCELIQSNQNERIDFIVSNPTFEFWILLHFKYSTKAFLNGEAVITELKKYIPDYKKNMDCYLKCGDKIEEALKNYNKLEKHYSDLKWPSVECNPRTDMGELMCLLSRWK